MLQSSPAVSILILPIPPNEPCYDLLLDIFYPFKALPIEVTWHKVEGHLKEKGKSNGLLGYSQ